MVVGKKKKKNARKGIRVAWRKDIRGGRFISGRIFIRAEDRNRGRWESGEDEEGVKRNSSYASPSHLHYVFLLAFPFLYFVMPIYGFCLYAADIRGKRGGEKPPPFVLDSLTLFKRMRRKWEKIAETIFELSF